MAQALEILFQRKLAEMPQEEQELVLSIKEEGAGKSKGKKRKLPAVQSPPRKTRATTVTASVTEGTKEEELELAKDDDAERKQKQSAVDLSSQETAPTVTPSVEEGPEDEQLVASAKDVDLGKGRGRKGKQSAIQSPPDNIQATVMPPGTERPEDEKLAPSAKEDDVQKGRGRKRKQFAVQSSSGKMQTLIPAGTEGPEGEELAPSTKEDGVGRERGRKRKQPAVQSSNLIPSGTEGPEGEELAPSTTDQCIGKGRGRGRKRKLPAVQSPPRKTRGTVTSAFTDNVEEEKSTFCAKDDDAGKDNEKRKEQLTVPNTRTIMSPPPALEGSEEAKLPSSTSEADIEKGREKKQKQTAGHTPPPPLKTKAAVMAPVSEGRKLPTVQSPTRATVTSPVTDGPGLVMRIKVESAASPMEQVCVFQLVNFKFIRSYQCHNKA